MNIQADLLTQDCIKFNDWLNDAKPWDRYVYYRGLLTENFNCPSIKHTVWKSAVKGRVYLFQKKVGPSEYDYIACKVGVRDIRFIPFDYYVPGKLPHMTRK